jgi:hypothetical protein
MATTGYHTSRRGWAVAAGCVFVILSFVDPVVGVAKGDNTLWTYFRVLLSGQYACSTTDAVSVVLMRAVFQLVPAMILGWVIQALFLVVKKSSRRTTPAECPH